MLSNPTLYKDIITNARVWSTFNGQAYEFHLNDTQRVSDDTYKCIHLTGGGEHLPLPDKYMPLGSIKLLCIIYRLYSVAGLLPQM